MELFNFVLLFIVQVSVAQYVVPPQMYENQNPAIGPHLYNFPPIPQPNVYNPPTPFTSSSNGADIFNGFLSSGEQQIGQLQNYNNQGGVMPVSNVEQILRQHITDWRILQTIVNNFFDSLTRFSETFLSHPTVFGGTSRNSLLNPTNLNALNEIYISLKYVGLGFIKIIKNIISSTKYLIQYYANTRNINFNSLIGHALKGIFKFWMFR